MDLVIKITPRRIERAIFILIILILISTNIMFYDSSDCTQEDVTEPEIIETEQETQQKEETNETEQETQQQNQEETGSEEEETTEPDSTGDCEEGWACKTPFYRGYRTKGCEWESLQACIDGCEDGECVTS